MKKLFFSLVLATLVLALGIGSGLAISPPQGTGTAAGGAPDSAHYLTDQAESGLSDEVVVSAKGKTLAQAADNAAVKAILGYYDATSDLDSDLQYLAGFTPTTDVKAILTAANNAAIKVLLSYYTAITDLDANVDATEYSYLNGVTSLIQTQIDAKQATVTEGSLADSVIVSADIKAKNVASSDLADAVNSVNQAVSVDDAGTLTPTAGYARVFIALTAISDPSAMTLSETGAVDNVIIYISNVGANTVTFADSAGVQELTSPATIEQTETITFRYEVDRWVEANRATNALGFSSITTTETEYLPISYMIDGASAPDALETITSGTDKVDVRTFQPAADEDVLFEWMMPEDIDASSGIKFRIVFYPTNATGPSSEVVQFELAGFSLGTGDPLNGTLGTVQTSTLAASSHAQYDRIATAWSSAMTSTHITDLSVDGETIIFKLNRNSGVASDYEQLVGVSGIELKYKRLHDATF